VTAAQVVLGRLDAEQFLGGDIDIDASLSEKAIKTHLADPMGLSVKEAALGILKIINNNMALAINVNSVAKGIDPRNFSLMAFGGAGPLHGVSLAEAISAKNVISPIQPGITAATGLLVTDLKYEYTTSTLAIINDASKDEIDKLNSALDELVAKADRQFDADGIPAEARRYERIAECRYLGQGFELRAKVPDGPITSDNVSVIIDSFYDEHKKVYGHAFRDQKCEVITLRVIGAAEAETLELPKLKKGGSANPEKAFMYARKTVFDNGDEVETPRYRRSELLAEDTVTGPAIIIQHNSTTVVPPGYRVSVDAFGDLLISAT